MTPAERELQTAVRRLTKIVEDQGREIRTLKTSRRAPQLGHSSIDSGALEVRDPETQATRMRIGWVNGEAGISYEGGSSVSSPSAPVVTPSLGGLRVTWDGTLSGDVSIPVDFDHMAVHVSTASGFVPSAATYVGSIRRAGEGGMLPVVPLPYVPHYVVLVPVTTGGVQGVPSAEVAATPLQTSGVDLQADSVDAVHIKAGAVEASKLEAILVLASTIIAGIPGAARVELDQDGLRGYNEANELIFAIDSAGNAVFSGDITASEISGSRFLMGQGDATGAIEETTNGVHARVRSGTMQAALGAINDVDNNAQANFLAVSDQGNPSTPMASFAAFPTSVVFGLDSSSTSADGLPAVRGVAVPTSAQLTLWSQLNQTNHPYQVLYAAPGQAGGQWTSATGSEIRIRAVEGWADISATPAASTVGQPDATAGYIYAFRRGTTDAPTLSLQSPISASGPGANRRSMIHLEGANNNRPSTVNNHSARRHFFQGELLNGDTDYDTDGVVEVHSTHSILAPRHQPLVTELTAAPDWVASAPTTGSFADFTSGQWPTRTWKTGWSGWVEFTIDASGLNPISDSSSLAVSFRLSGAGIYTPDLKHCVYIRSIGQGVGATRHGTATFQLQLAGNSTYTLTPQYRLSSYTTIAGRAATIDAVLTNRISIKNLT